MGIMNTPTQVVCACGYHNPWYAMYCRRCQRVFRKGE